MVTIVSLYPTYRILFINCHVSAHEIIFFISPCMFLWLIFVVAAWALSAIELNDDTFIGSLLSTNYTLVYFYRDHCKYCQEFSSDYEYLSLLYNGNDTSKFQIVKINGAKNMRANSLFKVDRYPTLKMYHNSTSEIVTFQQQRLFEAIVDFIGYQVPGIEPDYTKFKSQVPMLPGNTIEEDLTNTLVIFMLPNMDGWEDFGRPNHFMERAAASQNYKNVKFAVVDIFDQKSDLQQKYLVSNFPSAIYFGTNGRFKVLDTYSTNPDSRLEEQELLGFLNSLQNEDGWFENCDQLAQVIENSKYEGHKYHRPGFNMVQDRFENDHDPEYDDILEHLEL